jgi:hypothetical protein
MTDLLNRVVSYEPLGQKDKTVKAKVQELTRRLNLEGYLTAKGKERFDYSDYYLVEKELHFLNTTVLAIEHEYMDKWVGCCVNPGIALFLLLKKNSSETQRLSREKKCSLSLSTERTNDLKSVYKRLKKVMKVKEENVYYLNCKQSVRKNF